MKERLPFPRAILFDWDNTLVDSWEGMHRAMNATLTAMGHESWTMEEAQRRINRSLRDSFPTLFGDLWHEAHDIFYEAFKEGHIETLKVLPGAEEMLKTLGGMQIFMGVASNKVGSMLREEITYLGWDAYLPGVVGAGDAGKDKPAKEAALFAVQDMNIELGPELWVVGDLPVDVQFARNSGGTAVVMNNSLADIEEYGSLAPDAFVDSCKDLLPLITICAGER